VMAAPRKVRFTPANQRAIRFGCIVLIRQMLTIGALQKCRHQAGYGGSAIAFSHFGLPKTRWWLGRDTSPGIYRGSSTTQLIAFRDRLLYEAEIRGESLNLVVR
jgi:hypothetical protein